jgi:signal recognition particle subunit SRP68
MFGTFLAEQERDWDRALAKFMRARKAFEQLARVGGPDQADVCRERLEELEPTLRYCTYKRGSGGGGGGGSMDEEDLAALKGEGAVNDERLKAVLAEESGRASDTSAATMWRGHEIPIRSQKARACVANAVAQLAKLESPLTMSAERGLAIFDKTFMAYNDARQHLREELAAASSAQGGGSDSASRLAEIKLADRAIAVLLSEKTIERNKFLVSSANAKSSGEVKLEKGEKATRPEDLVHLFNTLLHNYEELAESGPEVLRGVVGAEGLEEKIRMECQLEQALVQAQRAAALARVHLGAGSHVEAAVLFARAAEHAARVQERAPGSSEIAAAAGRVQSEARKARCIALADGVTALLAQQKGLRTGFASVSLQEGPSSEGQQEVHYLMDHLDQYKSAVMGKGANKVHIAPIPPRMSSMGVRPIVLDVAGDEISYPDLTGRARVKKTSTLRNLFSFGGKR